MADTSIEWTDKTWNPTRGCALVSPGCTNCYAMKFAHRFSGKGGRYEGLTRLRTKGGAVWTGKVRSVPEMLEAPLRWKKPRKVFVNSMSDLFHEDVPFDFIAAVFGVMAACPQHTFQVLTKRPDRMAQWFHLVARHGNVQSLLHESVKQAMGYHHKRRPAVNLPAWPLPNVWLGVSVESSDYLLRLDELRKVPAAVRFASAEPLLGPLDGMNLKGIGWVIVGGESGGGARPFDLSWARSIVGQCKAAGVPVFVKQFGAAPVDSGGCASTAYPFAVGSGDCKGSNMADWPEDLRVRQWPAPAGGAA